MAESAVPFKVLTGGQPSRPEKRGRGRPPLVDPPELATMTFPHDDNHPMNRLPTTAERAVSFDPAAQTGAIGPADLQVSAVDERGHSAVVPSVRVPPILHYQLLRIVQSGKYPWKTIPDFVRWSLVEGLTKLSHLSADGLLSDANSRMRAMLNVLAAENVYRDFAEVIERARTTVDGLERDGYTRRSDQIIRAVWSEIQQVRDEDWRADLVLKFRHAFRAQCKRLGLGDRKKAKVKK